MVCVSTDRDGGASDAPLDRQQLASGLRNAARTEALQAFERLEAAWREMPEPGVLLPPEEARVDALSMLHRMERGMQFSAQAFFDAMPNADWSEAGANASYLRCMN